MKRSSLAYPFPFERDSSAKCAFPISCGLDYTDGVLAASQTPIDNGRVPIGAPARYICEPLIPGACSESRLS
jgi:hypothetical protein